MTNPTPSPETEQLRAAARLLVAAQLSPTVAPDEVSGTLAIRTGVAGKIPAPDGFIYPVALTVPAASERLDDAIARAACGPLFDRLGAGWVEQGSSTTYMLGLAATHDDAFARAMVGLAAISAVEEGAEVASLSFLAPVEVAPSGGRTLVAGERGVLTPVSVSELVGLAAVLDFLSDTPTSSVPQAFDPRHFDPQTVNVRDAYNRATPVPDIERQLEEQGWVAGDATDGVTNYARQTDGAAEEGALHGPARVFFTLEDRRPTRAFRAFDLYVLNPPKGVRANADELAQWLLENAQVAVETPILEVSGDRPRIDDGQDTPVIIRRFVEAIKGARLRSDRTMPLAFVELNDKGIATGLLTVTPAGSVTRWSSSNGASLLLAAAQLTAPGKETLSGWIPGLPKHGVPRPIVEGVLEALKTPGTLPPLEVIASEPIVTKFGVSARPGYHPQSRAVLQIPHYQRAAWRADYTVPETPTHEQAQTAYEYLRTELLDDFAFVSPTDKARAFAYLLTAAARNITSGSIGFAFCAPDAATGKSYLADLGRLLGKGTLASTTFQVGTFANEETQKALVSLLLSGGRFLHDDDVPRDGQVTGRFINSVITQEDGAGGHRILGSNTEVIQRGAIVTVCGNEMEFGKDLNRRFMRIHLQKAAGAIGLNFKQYRHRDLLSFVRENRPKLLAAVHTIILHSQQNKPTERVLPGMNFGHNWDTTILGAMTWLTEDGRDLADLALEGWAGEVAAGDQLSEDWGPLAAFVWSKVGDKYKTAAELWDLTRSVDQAREEAPPLPPKLADAYRGVSKSSIAQAWGRVFRSLGQTQIPYEGVVYRWTPLEQAKTSNKSRRYKLEAFLDGQPLRPGDDLPTEEQLAEQVARADEDEARRELF